MSRRLKYRGFFVTVAARCGVPAPIAEKILSELTKRSEEIEYAPERHDSGKIHVHFMLLSRRPTTLSNFKTIVQRIIQKHISAPDVRKRIAVRVIKDVDAVREYMSKSADMVCSFTKLKEYVSENIETAEEIIKDCAFYSSVRRPNDRFAYDNWDVWKTELDWTAPVQEIWDSYNHKIELNAEPTTRWKLERAFSALCRKAGITDREEVVRNIPKSLEFLEL